MRDGGWGSREPLARWRGVEADTYGHVTGVSLVDLKLRGGVPPTIGKLARLKRLVLKGNRQLTGPVPRELADLSHLSELDLSGTDVWLPGSRVRLQAAGLDPKRSGRDKVEALLTKLWYVPCVDYSGETSRGDAAAGTWIFRGYFRGDESRRRYGYDADIRS